MIKKLTNAQKLSMATVILILILIVDVTRDLSITADDAFNHAPAVLIVLFEFTIVSDDQE